jgi:hypothetical protein
MYRQSKDIGVRLLVVAGQQSRRRAPGDAAVRGRAQPLTVTKSRINSV